MQIWWRLARPAHHGAVAALWHQGRIFLVRPSYRKLWTLPGGGVTQHESPHAAVLRELREETSLTIPPESLTQAGEYRILWDGQDDHVIIFASLLNDPSQIQLDGWELREAALLTPTEALALKLPPFLRQYLQTHAREGGPV